MSWKAIDDEIDADLFLARFIPWDDAQREFAIAARDWCIRAKRAEEIQLKRGWGAIRWLDGQWRLASGSCEDGDHLDWNDDNGWPTPIECILANEEWYLANVEKP